MRDGTSLKIGTRGSKLALAQVALFIEAFRERHPEWSVEIVRISTKGDRVQDQPLAQIGGKALFVEEIETALRNGDIDVAVHSAKDIPSSLAADMEIVACLSRADARDVLVSRGNLGLAQLGSGARVGSSSPRRACQLRSMRSDIEVSDIRGNVDTRLAKLDRGDYDAIILAAAGLARLGLLSRVTQCFEVESMIPCAGQGAIALETARDSPLAAMLRALSDHETLTAVLAERAFAERVNGSCESPIAAHATVQGNTIALSAMLGNLDGRFVAGSLSGSVLQAVNVGQLLADSLLDGGGAELLGRASTRNAR